MGYKDSDGYSKLDAAIMMFMITEGHTMKYTNMHNGITIEIFPNEDSGRTIRLFDGKGNYDLYDYSDVAKGNAAYNRAFSVVANQNDAEFSDVLTVL